MTAPVLEVEGLRKEFVRGFLRKRTVAVDGISFAVEPGEVFGFLGPNGAGKTTTMKMLMGLIHPSAGKATILGAEVGDLDAKRRIGYLPENPYFYDYLSATEYLHMVGRIYGLDRATRDKRAAELLGRVGLAMAQGRAMRSYSKGMLQRVGLAQALIGDPELVVLDEPMSGLDPIGRREVRELILDLRAQGKTVFFSTHILADANLLCDRVAIIVKGKLRDVGPLGELLSPKVHRIEVLWQGDEALQAQLREQFPASHSSSSEGQVFVAEAQEQLDRFLAAILAGGGEVSSVTPQRETLEQLFVRDAGLSPEEQRS
ncbi:putative ABC transporter ATP-binding protein YxlF [Enhygromyxa salina]|uniref:Putative ABC transporter ATP-binding protein YxlF n=1 Tax=Enhygromyxa salina TaxID=215803 RepID=A0A2S9YAX5_9BACT|nr:ABC transporter ATP-binding protein [Enhygromyxa salina]PRQ02253.1 putative ABC transporter ATP-binding protein YxlF [Enhygromyxa salina]